MTVGEIIKAVRWCYDEEQIDSADFRNASANDNTYMDNIIKSKIGDAVRWICLYCPAELLGGTDSVGTATGIMADATMTPVAISETNGGTLTMPADFIKLVRVRVTGWHRAIMSPVAEDSPEYLQFRDEFGAKAVADRPMAAMIEKAAKQVEVWPTGTSAEVTYIADPSVSVESSAAASTNIALPPRAKTAFIYYLAFLTLSAYEDSRAPRMLEIAKMNTGRNG
jgi:hypothetical protein